MASLVQPKREEGDPKQQAMMMDEWAREVLKKLDRLIDDLRRASDECGRIQRGSPRAGALSGSTHSTREQLNAHKAEMEALFERYLDHPGMRKMKSCYAEFDSIVNERVNEAGYDDGYTDRVRYLEKMNFTSGTLKGHVEALLEQIDYQRTLGGGSGSPAVVRRLVFSEENSERVHHQTAQQHEPVCNRGDISGLGCISVLS